MVWCATIPLRWHFSYLVWHQFMGWELNKNQTQQLTHHSKRTEHIHRLWCIWNESLRKKKKEKCEVGVFAAVWTPCRVGSLTNTWQTLHQTGWMDWMPLEIKCSLQLMCFYHCIDQNGKMEMTIVGHLNNKRTLYNYH